MTWASLWRQFAALQWLVAALRAAGDVDTGQKQQPLGGGFFLGRFGLGRTEALATARQEIVLVAAGQKAVVADTCEPLGQDVAQETPDELFGREAGDFFAVAIGAIAEEETDFLVMHIEQA